jgi:hypothetical protein
MEGILANNLFKSIPGSFLFLVDGTIMQLVVLAVGDINANSGSATSGSNLRPTKPLPIAHPPIIQMPLTDVTATNNQYPWAILSDSTGSTVFIVARDISTFGEQYEQIVLQKVQSLGFTSADTKPVKINQSTDCKYPTAPGMI